MIRNWSIRNRVLLLALLPVVSLGIVLSGYFISSRVHDLKASQAALGHAIVNQLAPASVYGLLTHNAQALQALAQNATQEQNVELVTIADNTGHVLAATGHSMPQGRGLMSDIARRIGAQTGFEGALIFTRPITLSNEPIDESSEATGVHNTNAPPSTGTAKVLGSVTVRLSEVRFAERQAQIIVNGGIILLICLALSILLALIISGSVVNPIGRIIIMVRRFSAGDRAARVLEHSGGELGRLEQGINHMAANSQRSQHELQEQVDQATAELRGTLEEMEIKSVELDLSRKRAVEASQVKSEFLANMSHEIRTPMNAVLGFSDLLTKTPLNDGQRLYLATIRQSAQTLLALLDNVLNAARLETGEPSIQLRAFVLRDLLEEIVQVNAMDAYAKQLDLVLHIDGDSSQQLLGDRVKLTRVLSNLVTNAIKFTDTGSVVIRCHTRQNGPDKVDMDISINDTGIGIREQDRRRLFEPFFQIDSSADRQHGGAGLGLYITKRLVEQMGGALTLTSAFGHGSEFHVSLAFARDTTSALPPAVSIPAGRRQTLLVYEPHAQAAEALVLRLARLGWKTRQVISHVELQELLHAQNLGGVYAAALLSLNYADMRKPAWLDTLLADAAAGLPALALVNSVNAEVHADISRRLTGPCLPKSITEAVLGSRLDELLGNVPSQVSAEPASDAQALRGMKVIVADDNRINRLLARILLEKYGAIALEAKTGQEIMNLMTEHSVNLILLDMHMPDEDGWQVAMRLKSAQSGRAAIPVIALSATRNEKPAQTLAEHGLADWLTKPLDEITLREVVLKHVRLGAMAPHAIGTTPPRNLKTTLADLRPPIRQMLTEDLPVQWQAIESAWQDRDFPHLMQYVHKLNGSAAFCRLVNLRELCERLEGRLRDKNHAGLTDLLAQLGGEVCNILTQLGGVELNSATSV
ncbi:MAG: ATP-binding protein [Gammaproteobacteria bacterium]